MYLSNINYQIHNNVSLTGSHHLPDEPPTQLHPWNWSYGFSETISQKSHWNKSPAHPKNELHTNVKEDDGTTSP